MKKIIALVLALVMVLALCACGAKEEAAPAAPAADEAAATLILGTSADYAPFEFMYPDENGEMVYGGIDVSVVRRGEGSPVNPDARHARGSSMTGCFSDAR